MSRRSGISTPVVLGLAALLLVVAALVAWWWLRDDADEAAGSGGEGGPAVRLAVELYFPGEAALLERERRELEVSEDPEAQLDALARALVAGPRRGDLFPPLPDGVSVRSVSLGSGGVVYVDLVSADGGPPPSGGSTEERLRVYSLVDTLVLNVDEAESVVLLWNGVQPETLSGHVDLTRPLLPDPSMIAPRRGGDPSAAAPAAAEPQ